MKKEGSLVQKKKHIWKKKKQVSTGFCRVVQVTNQPGGSTEFDCLFALTGLSPYLDQSNHRVNISSWFRFHNYGGCVL
jgi:hypothetical protein